jgi:hypothetical protein
VFGRLPDAAERVARDKANPLFAEAAAAGQFDVLATLRRREPHTCRQASSSQSRYDLVRRHD